MKELRIVCSEPPAARGDSQFLETEDETGRSVNVGRWRERKDGLWELVIIVDTLR
jgi:hypothetical protein